jgi:hypothetical protein
VVLDGRLLESDGAHRACCKSIAGVAYAGNAGALNGELVEYRAQPHRILGEDGP